MSRLIELNRADEIQAIALLAPLIERAPEIAKQVARRRPFRSADDLFQAIHDALLALSESACIGLFRAHPELAPDNPLAMTEESQSEQGRLNLTSHESEYRTRLNELNARYREKYGFPFITALARHENIDSVLKEFEARLKNDRDTEIRRAIDQIAVVSSTRVRAKFGSDDSRTSEISTANSCTEA